MKSGFDYSEYTKWANNLGIVRKDFRNWLESFLLTEAQRVIKSAKEIQQNYEYMKADGTIKTGVIDTGTMLNSWYITDIIVSGGNLQVEIGNSVDYASYIEYGHHSFEGVYILTISINEVYEQLPARFNQEWLSFLNSKGV